MIAKRLYISERTLYNHISNIYDKLQVNNSIEAFNKALEIGYIDPIIKKITLKCCLFKMGISYNPLTHFNM